MRNVRITLKRQVHHIHKIKPFHTISGPLGWIRDCYTLNLERGEHSYDE